MGDFLQSLVVNCSLCFLQPHWKVKYLAEMDSMQVTINILLAPLLPQKSENQDFFLNFDFHIIKVCVVYACFWMK